MRLAILSERSDFMGRELRQYPVDGVNTIGVFGDEPYKLVLTSSTKVQVIISIDGRNVLTGRDAYRSDLQHSFVVRPGRPSSLYAWPETTENGRRFVFTDAGDSVAAHTPGDLGSVGYISVAVFVEGYVPPVFDQPVFRGDSGMYGAETTRSMSRSAVGTGAGAKVQQHIGSAQGLIEPTFSEIVQVRYLWWDDLQAALHAAGIEPGPVHPTGFLERQLADLGDTPFAGSAAAPSTGFQRLV